ESANATDDHHRQNIEGLGDKKCVWHQGADEARVKTAGCTGSSGADTEREDLPDRGINTKRGSRNFVLANGRECLANRRTNELVQEQIDEKCEGSHQIKKCREVVKIGDHRSADDQGRPRRSAVNTKRPLCQAYPVK